MNPPRPPRVQGSAFALLSGSGIGCIAGERTHDRARLAAVASGGFPCHM